MKRTTLPLLLIAFLVLPVAPAAADCTEIGGITIGECDRPPKRKTKHPTPSDDLTVATKAERRLLEKVNEERTSRGLDPLVLDVESRQIARAHSRDMARRGKVYHNPDLRSDENRRAMGYPSDVGENVGVGPTAGSLHEAFMSSDRHRANILGRYRTVGIGVISDGGSLWVTQVFATPTRGDVLRGVTGAAGKASRGRPTLLPHLPGGLAESEQVFGGPTAAAATSPWGWVALTMLLLAVPGSIRALAVRRRAPATG